jgi:DGQHR domain-containing protein
MSQKKEIDRISVVVPKNPFTPRDLGDVRHCLCALDVERLMEWWPGIPHQPHRDAKKVKAIQRSLDWKRVAQIAAYLLQSEIPDAGEALSEVFDPIYEPRKNDPGRQWPPPIRGTIKSAKSSFPFCTNVLIHVNGATFVEKDLFGTAEIGLDPRAENFQLSVIDGQHRVNGAYFALMIRKKVDPKAKYEVPSEIFLDLDKPGEEPRRQAQIFIDVNLYQKKVDRSLVADLFPTTRGNTASDPLDRKDRAQDIGRKLMLEVGPLVGMIQIPGIRYGVKDVVTLATLNAAIETCIPPLSQCDITNLESQTAFIAQVLESWLEATGRAEESSRDLNPQNVVYQGRILVSVLDLLSAALAELKKKKIAFTSDKAKKRIAEWFRDAIDNAGLLKDRKFVDKDDFKELGFLGSGGIGRFRNLLWAAAHRSSKVGSAEPERIADWAAKSRDDVNKYLGGYAD